MRALSVLMVLTLPLLAGCVSGSGTSGPSGTQWYPISREEIQSQPTMSAFEIVSHFRPNWIRGHSVSALSDTGRNYPAVFVDGRPFGGIESLDQFGTEAIQEFRFLSASDATTRYGTGYPAGIIEVITRR